jgi:gas vesicle protein
MRGPSRIVVPSEFRDFKEMAMSDERGNDAAGYIGWFFLGAIAGAAAALLLTPKSGRETREFLAERGGELLKKAQEKAGETQGMAGDLFDRGRDYLEEQTQRLASAFEAGRAAMKDEISRAQPSE